MSRELTKALKLFSLDKVDRDIYCWSGESVGYGRIFGGQVMAQSLMAAYETVDKSRLAHSFHSYFLRPGDMKRKIIFDVDRIRDGKSFTTRRVRAIQNGEAIFNCSISFQINEKGLSHQTAMPKVPGPDDLESEWSIRYKNRSKVKKKYLSMWLRKREFEIRHVETQDLLRSKKTPPYRNTWIKPTGKLPSDQKLHQAFLLYVSDIGLVTTMSNPHGISFMSKKFQSASLDHVMWFHKKVNFNHWLLYSVESPVSSGARGFARGAIYTKSGNLIASTAQEGLIRLWD